MQNTDILEKGWYGYLTYFFLLNYWNQVIISEPPTINQQIQEV